MKITVRLSLVTLFLINGISWTSAQDFLPVFQDTLVAVKHEISLNGRADFLSTSFRNDFSKRIFLGGNIDNEMKSSVLNRHKPINRFGFDAQTEIEYRSNSKTFFKSKEWSWLVRGGAYTIGSGVYSTDLMRLALNGNQACLGDTIQMAGTGFNFYSFQKIGFGFHNRKTKSSFALNLVNLSTALNGNLYDGSLHHSTYGDTLFLAVDGQFNRFEKARFSSGIGFAIDFDFRIPFNWGENKTAFIQFQAKNLGFTFLTQPLKRFETDSNWVYNGFSVNQLTQENGPFGSDFSLLDSLGIYSKNRKGILALPGFLQIGKIIDAQSNSRFQTFYGVRVYPSLFFIPQAYAGVHSKLAENWVAGLSASYGGTGNFRGGLYAGFTKQNWQISVGTEDLFGLISNSGFGYSAQTRVKFSF